MNNNYTNKKNALALLSILIMLVSFTTKVKAQSFTEGFEVSSPLTDWWVANTSDDAGTTINWFRGRPTTFIAQAGSDSSYLASNYQSDTNLTTAGTISDWLITPNRVFNNGDVVTFYTRTIANPATYPDNLQVRFSSNGTSTNVGTSSATVGDFTTLLLEINPTLSLSVYPAVWTQYTITISGLAGPTSGRVAFRYYVTNGGAAGANSYYIGIDTYSYTSNTATSDATVSNVYTLGTIARPFGSPHQVKANITNTGTVTLTNKVVTLNVTGSNTFTNTQTIASLAPGASTIVTFAGYSSTVSGTNTVTVSVPADAVAAGNSIAVIQTVNTNSYNYAYGTAVSGGVGFNGATGDVAVKFNTSSATTVTQVNANLNAAGRPYNVKIWDATGTGGIPGTLLYTSATLTSVAGITPVTISPAVAVNGGFYVGFSQTDTTNLNVSYQTESPLRTGTFYYSAPTGANTWADITTIPATFRIMLEPVFGCAAPVTPGAISGTASACLSSVNTYSITAVSGATSYTWTLPSGWSGTSVTNSISATAGATGGIITVTATNSCGTSAASSLTVTSITTPAQPGTITGTTQVCANATGVAYSVTNVAGTTYNWTVPAGASVTAGQGTNSIVVSFGTNSGTISVTAGNSCGTSSPQIYTVAVNSAPAQPGAISGGASLCQGAVQTYSVTAVAGATSYTWTLPSGWSGSSTTNSISATAGASGGTITVTAINSCGTGSTQTLPVTITTTPPQPGSITGNTTFCPGQSNTYSITAMAGATSYTWTLPSGWSGTSNTNSITTTSSSTGGIIQVTYTTSCGTSPAQLLTVSLGSAPAQPGAITGNAVFCPGDPLTYSISPVSGAVSYNWTLPPGWSGTSTNNVITTTGGSSGGVVSVTAINPCGTSPAQLLSVSLGNAPAQPGAISGSNTICSGTNQTYSISPVAGATSYTWTLPSGWAGASNTTSITTIPSTSGGVVSVVAVGPCGTSSSQLLSVTVNSIPAQPVSINGSNSVCSGISGIYSITPVTGATNYTWTLPSGWSGSSSTNSITATAGSLSGTLYVTVTNSCGTSPSQSLSVASNSGAPVQPGTITGLTTVCSASSQTYSVSSVANATSYNWTLPVGWSGTSTTNSITTTIGTGGGSISVSAQNGCGTSSSQTLAVTVNQSPNTPGVIAGQNTVCAGSAQNYFITLVSGATTYTWTLPSGWSGSSSTTAISTTAGSSGTISVTANNAQCSSPAQTLAVTVNTIPAAPATITGSSSVCASTSQTYTAATVTGATSYIWTLPSGWSGSSTTATINSTAGTAGGNITVEASNSCGTSPAQSISVNVTVPPAQPASITGNTNVCLGTYETYSIPALSGATSYAWTLPSGWSGSSSTTSITATTATGGGIISVMGLNGTCAGPAQLLTVIFSPAPAQPAAISGTLSVCDGTTHTYYVPAVSGASSYVWTTPSGWTGTSTTDSITVVANTTSGNISVSAIGTCGTSAAQTASVTVNALPPVPVITPSGNVLSSSASTGNQWNLNGTAISGATSQFYTMTSTGFYTVTVTNASGCSSTSAVFNNTGISENELNNMFTLFPNPSHDVINITLKTDKTIEVAYITDIAGKTVKVINAKNFKSNAGYPIEIKELNSGMYLFTLQIEGRLVTKKIIVE